MDSHTVTVVERRRVDGDLRRLGYIAACSCGRWAGQPAKTPGKAARQHRRHRSKANAIAAQRRARSTRGEPRGGKRPVTSDDDLNRILARHAAARVTFADVPRRTESPQG